MSLLLLLAKRNAGGAFTPASIPGLALWLKADAGTLQTSGGSAASADGDPAGEWRDQSGNGRHLSQVDFNRQPTLKLAVQNGLPVVRFDGVDDFLTIAGLVLPQPYTIWMVAKNSTDGGYYCDGDEVNRRLVQRVDATTLRCFQGSVADVTVTDQGASNSILIGYDGASSLVRFNGVETAISPGTTTANGFRLGANAVPGSFSALDVCEAALFSAIPSAEDRASLHAYSQSRWGTP